MVEVTGRSPAVVRALGALMCDGGVRLPGYQWWSDDDDDGSGGGGRDVRGEVVSVSSRSCSLMTGL